MANKVIFHIDHNCQGSALKELQYVVDFLNHHPYCLELQIKFDVNEPSERSIYYGDNTDHEPHFLAIPKHRIELSGKSDALSLACSEYQGDKNSLYDVSQSKRDTIAPFCTDKALGFDIFQTIFFHISRVEELYNKQSDEVHPKLAFESNLFLVRHGIEHLPVVDDIVDELLFVLAGKHPLRKKFQIISHDIDVIQKYPHPLSFGWKLGSLVSRKRPLSEVRHLFKSYGKYIQTKKDPYDSFDQILEKKEMAGKEIYWLVGGYHRMDSPNNMDHPIAKNAIQLCRERGYKIGIHPSFDSWNRIDLIKEQKQLLEEKIQEDVTISRQHFLNFDIAITPYLLIKSGIREDSTLGYTRYIGYRCGTAYPYYLYDFEKQQRMELLEKPMVFMDSSWQHLKEREEKRLEREDWNGLRGGFNFHNSCFEEIKDWPPSLAIL